jgi:hypothetical protein
MCRTAGPTPTCRWPSSIEVWDEIYPVTVEWKRGGLPQGDFEREVERPQ